MRICVYAHTRKYGTCAHMQLLCMHACMQTQYTMYLHSYIHTYIYTHIHTYTRTYTHTHTHTQQQHMRARVHMYASNVCVCVCVCMCVWLGVCASGIGVPLAAGILLHAARTHSSTRTDAREPHMYTYISRKSH